MASLDFKLGRLHETLKPLGPVVGVDGVVQNVNLKYDPQPTAQELSEVEAALAAFDWSDAADAAYFANLNPERKTLREQAAMAITRLDQIINFSGTPNAMQIYNAVKDIALYEKHIIKRLIQID
jgi:hypothetical protein